MPEAERAIGPWRRVHTPDGRAGMPGHVTLLYPFAPEGGIEPAGLREVFAAAGPVDYVLDDIREFADTVVYLPPEPAAPFAALTRALVERHPACLPYRGAVELDALIPHVTVVHTEDEAVRAEATASVRGALPIRCNASEAWLVHEVEGRWQRHTPFPLGR